MSRPSTREPVSEQQKEAFIEALAEGDAVGAAADKAGRGRRDFYRLKAADPDFAAEWRAAWKEGTDTLIAEAQRRAVEGVPRNSYDKEGRLIREETVYSDALMMFLVKQRDSSYRDRVSVEGGGDEAPPIVVEHRGVSLGDILRVAREAGVELGDGDA